MSAAGFEPGSFRSQADSLTSRPSSQDVSDCAALEQISSTVEMLRTLRRCLSSPKHLLTFSNKSSDRLAELVSRREALEQRCALYKTDGAPVVKDSFFVFDFIHRLSYCKVYKSGSSTMLTFLLHINGFDATNLDAPSVHLTARQLFPHPFYENITSFSRNFIRVFTIRHPFRRIVSSYCNKFVMNRSFKKFIRSALTYRGRPTLEVVKEILPQYRFQGYPEDDHKNTGPSEKQFIIFSTPGKEKFLKKASQENQKISTPSEDSPTFREFVLCLAGLILRCKGDLLCEMYINEHFVPQTILCSSCEILPDLILKVETLDEDLRYLAHLLKVPQQTAAGITPSNTTIASFSTVKISPYSSGPIPATIRVNAANSSCLTYSQYMGHLTGQEIDLLYTSYYNDFQLLGYEPFD
ncbi:Sulfotransferase [Trinorchestia longiramus]|nr:Sulfotransferase [Trinorchestia longiramus]